MKRFLVTVVLGIYPQREEYFVTDVRGEALRRYGQWCDRKDASHVYVTDRTKPDGENTLESWASTP